MCFLPFECLDNFLHFPFDEWDNQSHNIFINWFDLHSNNTVHETQKWKEREWLSETERVGKITRRNTLVVYIFFFSFVIPFLQFLPFHFTGFCRHAGPYIIWNVYICISIIHWTDFLFDSIMLLCTLNICTIKRTHTVQYTALYTAEKLLWQTNELEKFRIRCVFFFFSLQIERKLVKLSSFLFVFFLLQNLSYSRQTSELI